MIPAPVEAPIDTSIVTEPLAAVDKEEVGGINLSSKLMNLQIKRDAKGIPLPFDRQDLEQMRDIKGFLPIIIDIRPIFNLPQLLGLNPDGSADADQHLSGYGQERAIRES